MITIPLTDDLVRGAAEIERTAAGIALHRLPSPVRTRYPDPQLLAMEAQPSGTRVVFATSATRLELITHPRRVAYAGVDRARGRIDVMVDGVLHLRDELTGGDSTTVDLTTGAASAAAGPDHVTRVSGLGSGEKRVEIWLPHNETILLRELRGDAPAGPILDHGRLWVHHGSSISHGSNALGPTGIWPAIAARTAGVELRNLGFGGSALVDPFMARLIRDSPADVISIKLGINVVNLDAMHLRSFVPAVHGFLDTIRDGHPDTPLLLVSPLHCAIHERTPGPGAFDPDALATGDVRFIATGDPRAVAAGRLTLEVIRDVLRGIAAERSDDVNLHHLDGLELFGAADEDAFPLPDALHPGPDAHELIGRRFAERAFGQDGAFA